MNMHKKALRNPSDNSTALTITPLAGGTQPVSAHLGNNTNTIY